MSYWSWCCLDVPCMYKCTHGTVFLLVSVQRVKWGINQWDTLILPLHYILSCSWLYTEAVEFVCCVWPEIGVNKSSLFVGGWIDDTLSGPEVGTCFVVCDSCGFCDPTIILSTLYSVPFLNRQELCSFVHNTTFNSNGVPFTYCRCL